MSNTNIRSDISDQFNIGNDTNESNSSRLRSRRAASAPQQDPLSESEVDPELVDMDSGEEYIEEFSDEEWQAPSNTTREDNYYTESDNENDEEAAERVRALFSSDEEEEYEDDENEANQFLEEDKSLQKQKEKRIAKMTKSLAIKDEARIYYNLAIKEYEENRFGDAIAMLEEAIKIDPNSKLPYVLLDAIYSDIGDVDKALRAKVAAALLDRNKDDWIDVARISVELGKLDQAVVFYERAIGLDTSDTTIMFDLFELLLSMNKLEQACTLMKKIHDIHPANPEYTNRLGQVYMLQGQLQDAVNLFENILQQNKESSFIDPEIIQPFGWSELNSLAELYYKQKAWHKTIREVKSIARWILERKDETWWEDQNDDAEFDERRLEIKRSDKGKLRLDEPEKYELPLDIRVKLLLSRLQLENIEEAKHHNRFLLEADPHIYLDLFWEVGTTFMNCGYYELALELLFKLLQTDNTASELLLAIGKCEMGIRNWDEAEKWFRLVIKHDPYNVEALVGLAETCYALDRDEEARSLIEEVQLVRNEIKEKEQMKEHQDRPAIDDSSLYQETERSSGTRKIPSRAEKKRAEAEADAIVEKSFRELQRYWTQIASNINNMVAVTEWTQIANTLVNIFLSVKRFYSRHGSRLTIFQRGEDADIYARLEKLSLSIKENEIDSEADSGGVIKAFRGLPIDTWFDIFMQVWFHDLHLYWQQYTNTFLVCTFACCL